MKKTVLGIAALLVATLASADDRLNPQHPDVYTVKSGDTLWDISSYFLRDPWVWPEIWYVNPQVQNPHLIYPGDQLRLIYIDGQPRLTVDRGPTPYRLSPDSNRLSPGVRRQDLSTAIPAIPLDAINAFLSQTRIVDPNAFDGTPYIISGEGERLLVGTGETVYARGDFADALPAYGIYRPGPVYRDPQTKEILGRQALDVGSVDLYQLDEDEKRNNWAIATMEVTRTSREVRLEDRLLPVEERAIAALFQPGAPAMEVDGEIMAVEDGVSQIAKYDVVALNRGAREGLQPGHVLAIYKRGATVRDRLARDAVKLPDERAGFMMVFRSFEKMSLALVLESDKALAVGDLIRNP
ncbi:LysM peptidoglycan-binding domain-containing protein [Biformimicrobium ophioploci]|uniref:LysM peptidoglycan-binding domain-containing protein n=1 Tax=Biformimicrobium ophioploci TaxID=3036711 RepID=A0ABQ6LVA1_9GAMM|nr:LysM peptidoglycan-binding domain-containing protein [Microbulbifer sp. NKW57]GMG86028.1 LysM peptidoglycan-binding domain-containing protein [Microbulbifer sp. NKW57]